MGDLHQCRCREVPSILEREIHLEPRLVFPHPKMPNFGFKTTAISAYCQSNAVHFGVDLRDRPRHSMLYMSTPQVGGFSKYVPG